jgi:transcriptional regulator with XRE-family HTH domain
MTIQELFITNLRDYRRQCKLSQLKLAEKCNSSQTYIAEIETGKKFPSPDTIERIAAALDIPSYYLFQNEPVNTPDTTERRLSPSQRQEITEQLYSAAIKIIDRY